MKSPEVLEKESLLILLIADELLHIFIVIFNIYHWWIYKQNSMVSLINWILKINESNGVLVIIRVMEILRSEYFEGF